MRFFVELITEAPTRGCVDSPGDRPIYKTQSADIPFNISDSPEREYHKYHFVRPFHGKAGLDPEAEIKKLIFILRNPREVLVRHPGVAFPDLEYFAGFFHAIDFFIKHKGDKKLFFYEDMVESKVEFVQDLYLFLGPQKPSKLNYILDNIDALYNASAHPEGKRAWDGVNSSSTSYYYRRLRPNPQKEKFDNYLDAQLKKEKYSFIRRRYD